MKRKNGFTLIELVVVIALIAILAVTLAPRLRDQLAKARDSKAIAVLGSLRTASEIYFAEEGEPIGSTTGAVSATNLTELKKGLDNSAVTLLDDSPVTNGVPVGGGRINSSTNDVLYGGGVAFQYGNPESTTGDGISIWFSASTAVDKDSTAIPFDTKGTSWSSY